MVVLTWLYLSGYVFLVGGELNAVIEHASRSGKKPGEHAEGEGAEPVVVELKAASTGPAPPPRVLPREERPPS